jgi:hypothetical protein
MYFYIYDINTGQVIRTGQCPKEFISLQVIANNEVSVEGYANDIRHKVVDGSLVLKTDQELTDQYSNLMSTLGITLEQFKEMYSNYV